MSSYTLYLFLDSACSCFVRILVSCWWGILIYSRGQQTIAHETYPAQWCSNLATLIPLHVSIAAFCSTTVQVSSCNRDYGLQSWKIWLFGPVSTDNLLTPRLCISFPVFAWVRYHNTGFLKWTVGCPFFLFSGRDYVEVVSVPLTVFDRIDQWNHVGLEISFLEDS